MLFFFINVLAKDLLVSNIPASLVGPKTFIPESINKLERPASIGASGPIITKSNLEEIANSYNLFVSSIETSTFSAISSVPGLPGATINSEHNGLCKIFQAMQCSLAPFPINKIFKN